MARRISEVSRFARLAIFIYVLSLCSYESTSITLSPLGMVTVCPGGQLSLTCERISGAVLYWDFSVPHMADTINQRLVPSQGGLLSPDFRIGFTEFNISRTSDNPLISQLLISNVTTEINGSTIYCSEDGIETNAPMTVINVKYKDEFLRSMDHSLNVTMVNQLLRSDDVTVTLQWPREPGTVYHVSVSPEISHTEHVSMGHYIFAINLIISYSIQYNVSIISSLCGVTSAKVLNYVTCNYPPTPSLHHLVVVVSGSQDSPPIEGQFITYTCPPGFVQTGPNVSVCTGNGEWEPDPGEVDCIADCELPLMDISIKLNFNSTLEGSVLTLTCENEISNFTMNATKEILNVICHSNGSWIPNPADFIQSCSPFSTTVSPTTEISAGLIIGSVLAVLLFGVVAIIVTISAVLIKKGFLHLKRVNRPPDIRLENTYHLHAEQNSSEQPVPVIQQDTLVYADIGPSSFKKRSKQIVTLSSDGVDDRVEYALLNHSLQKPVIVTNQDSIADDCLNLDTLLIQVRGAVTPHWYQLGQALEVSKDVLDRCSNYPPEESIVEILDQWLRNFPGRPTWRDVANALRKIGVQQLANDIEKVYETGKLPIQINDDDDDTQQVFTTTASTLELNKPEEDKPTFNNCQDQDELAPPLPPKPLAESDMPKAMSAPSRPPKYTAK